MPGYVDSMMYVGQTPWHGIGVALEQPPSAAEAIVAAGLDWDVEKRPLYVQRKSRGRKAGSVEPVPRFNAVARKDTGAVLGVVGQQWKPLQNRSAFAFFDPFVSSGAAEYHTAGSLKEGQYVWVLAKIAGDPSQVAKDDLVDRYLLLSNAHDGKSSISIRFTPVRVVCWNTLTMAESDATRPFLRVLHRGNLTATLRGVQDVVDLTQRTFAATMEQYRFLAQRQVKHVEQYITEVLGAPADPERPPRAVEPILELFEGGRGQDNRAIRGSYWAAYNAVTEWVDHQRGRDDTRLVAAWYGAGQRLKQRALSVATDLAQAA